MNSWADTSRSAQAGHGTGATQVSIVIPTRDRPEFICDAVASVLANEGVEFELIVVDQSFDTATRDALAPWLDDSRLRYIATTTRGVAAARNVGVQASRSAFILFTDDDCTAPADWARRHLSNIQSSARASIVYAPVKMPDDHPLNAMAMTFDPTAALYHRRLPKQREPWGISANMAVRRDLFDTIGLFDETLGAGSHFGSGAETDLTIRTIGAGSVVQHVTNPTVLHVGYREGAQASALGRRYGLGVGAVLMKHARLRTRPGRFLLVTYSVSIGVRSLRNLMLGRRPTGLGFTLGLIRGAWGAMRHPLDRSRGIYCAASAPVSYGDDEVRWDDSDGPRRS